MSRPLRVLIAEDSEDDAWLLVRELRRDGYDVTHERIDTPAAMNAALDKPWDIVIADYVMPHFSGLDALKLVQEKGLDLPFIIVSGQIGEATAVDAMRAGAHDYIMKGNVARLLPAVDRELREAEGRRERRRTEEALRLSELKSRELEAHRQEFYRRTILAATGGRLVISERNEILELTGAPLKSWQITEPRDLGIIRSEVAEAARSDGMDELAIDGLLVGIGEAGANALKHAGGGNVSLHRSDGALICVIEDDGNGIEALNLPAVALVPGYSTAGTMGMGYKLMIALADKVYLATGPDGTTVAMQVGLHSTAPLTADFAEQMAI